MTVVRGSTCPTRSRRTRGSTVGVGQAASGSEWGCLETAVQPSLVGRRIRTRVALRPGPFGLRGPRDA